MSEQLSATGMQISQIATMLGYSEQSSYAEPVGAGTACHHDRLIAQKVGDL